MRAWGVAIAVAVMVAPLDALEPDADSVARAGACLLERLDASPAAPLARVPVVAVDVRRIDAEAGIDALSVRGTADCGQLTLAAAADRVRSPVHADLGGTAAVRWQRDAVGIGLALELRQLRFGPGVSLARVRFRAGCGVRRGGNAAAVVFEERSAGEAPRLRGALRLMAATGLAVETEMERQPGARANTRVALGVLGGAAQLWCGYETATAAAAAGVGVVAGRLRVAGAARVHPDLGWSPVWTLEWRP